jgi:hypothetical protein
MFQYSGASEPTEVELSSAAKSAIETLAGSVVSQTPRMIQDPSAFSTTPRYNPEVVSVLRWTNLLEDNGTGHTPGAHVEVHSRDVIGCGRRLWRQPENGMSPMSKPLTVNAKSGSGNGRTKLCGLLRQYSASSWRFSGLRLSHAAKADMTDGGVVN